MSDDDTIPGETGAAGTPQQGTAGGPEPGIDPDNSLTTGVLDTETEGSSGHIEGRIDQGVDAGGPGPRDTSEEDDLAGDHGSAGDIGTGGGPVAQ